MKFELEAAGLQLPPGVADGDNIDVETGSVAPAQALRLEELVAELSALKDEALKKREEKRAAREIISAQEKIVSSNKEALTALDKKIKGVVHKLKNLN